MKDMELYDSFIRETNDLLGAPTQKWAYKAVSYTHLTLPTT